MGVSIFEGSLSVFGRTVAGILSQPGGKYGDAGGCRRYTVEP
jgi:hypothetical protein